ncbi:MAG: C-terminal helicase domain-containing protein, partial [Pseudomonadota bacterium]|nr:C-terminal helicase domain-containing protein [Pseudomonadota bacterium]
ALHGDMAQASRLETLSCFKNRQIDFLVASDVAARGLDIDDLPVVFNFDVPIHAEDYIHRIGRTGRAGREGKAFTLASPGDADFIASIEKLIGNPIPRIKLEGLVVKVNDGEDTKFRKRSRRKQNSLQERDGDRSRRHKSSQKNKKSRENSSERGKVNEGTRDTGSETGNRHPTPANTTTDEKVVVGLGDHMPDFLKNPARPP